MIYVKLRAIEQATGSSQLFVTVFVGDDRLKMQNAGELRLTFREYEEFAVGFLVTASLSVGDIWVDLDGWAAEQLKYKFVRWTYDMNIKEALDVCLGPDQGSLSVMDPTGDTKVIWDRTKPLEVEIARDAFDKAKARGYMAYKVEGKDGKKAEVMHSFDPLAERVILAPPMQGGS